VLDLTVVLESDSVYTGARERERVATPGLSLSSTSVTSTTVSSTTVRESTRETQ
jgi:hypothetical protein